MAGSEDHLSRHGDIFQNHTRDSFIVVFIEMLSENLPNLMRMQLGIIYRQSCRSGSRRDVFLGCSEGVEQEKQEV